MKTIWKFELTEGAKETAIDMPRNAEVLTVAWQGRALCLWALVRPGAPKEQRRFAVHVTGGAIPEAPPLEYIGTVHSVDDGSPLVLHVFEIGGAS